MPSAVDLNTIVERLLFSSPGQPGWEANMRLLMRAMSDPESVEALANDPTVAARVDQFLGAMLQNHPDETQVIMTELGIELGLSEEQQLLENYQSILDGLLSQSGLQDIVENISRNIDTTIEEATRQTRTAEELLRTTGEEVSVRHETRFVDVPTPEEFLNNFETAIITQADTLKRSGQIDQLTKDFMTNNPGFFFNDYIADLGRRAQAGEDIFKVVGLDQQPVRIGARPGEAIREEVTSTLEAIRTGTLTIEDVVERTIERLVNEAGTQTADGDVGTTTLALKESITEQVNEIFRQFSTETSVEERVSTLTGFTIEEVLQRPNLTTVFAFTPTQFLTERFSPTELMNIAVAIPGREAAARQQPFGVAPSAPRRLA
jgi:hypothetical protein